MDKVATRILKELVMPACEKLLSSEGLGEKDWKYLSECVDLAKDLLEIDCLYAKLDKPEVDMDMERMNGRSYPKPTSAMPPTNPASY